MKKKKTSKSKARARQPRARAKKGAKAKADAAARKLLNKALAGDVKAIRKVLDIVEGPVEG